MFAFHRPLLSHWARQCQGPFSAEQPRFTYAVGPVGGAADAAAGGGTTTAITAPTATARGRKRLDRRLVDVACVSCVGCIGSR
ncbi:hypothetical protein SALBM135S_02201 [Streptomyces alboniger]